MNDTDRTIENRSQYFVKAAFRRFFIPSITSSLWIALAGFADCFLVGNSIGTNGLAAISLGQPVYLFYNILSYGMSIGGSIHCAAKFAEGREEEGNRIFLSVVRLLLSLYIVTAAIALIFLSPLMRLLGADPADEVTRTYIRTQLLFVPLMFCQGPFYYFVNADNAPVLASTAMSVSSLIDIVLSYVFLIRLRIGVAGSVYSTAAGAVVMLCMTASHIVLKRGVLRFRMEKMDWKASLIAARTGFSTSAQYLCEFISMIAVNRLLIHISGAAGVAAFDVVYNVSTLFAAITDGVVVATEPMLSSYRSERNLGNIRGTLKVSLDWAYALAFILAALLLTSASALTTGFGLIGEPERGYTVSGIRTYLFCAVFFVANSIFSGYYQSILREKYSYIITFLRSFVFYLPSLFICAQGGMKTFWYFFTLSEGATFLAWMIPLALRRDILQLRSIDTRNAKSVFIDSSEQELAFIIEDIQRFCEERQCQPRQTLYIGLTIEEICSAIIERFRERMGEIYIQVTVVADKEGCSLYIRDNAYAYNPMEEDTKKIDLKSGDKVELLGIDIVQKTAEEFYYRRYSGFNTLVLRL